MAKSPMKKPSQNPKRLSNRTIVLVVTGSVAACKIGDLAKMLRMEGARVIYVMSPSAKHFVTPLILKTFSGERVYEDFFTTDAPYGVLHTELAERADLILVAPASADFIAKMRAGLAEDLASCLILACQKPVVVAPAMNDLMLKHPVTQANIQFLKEIGYGVIDPIAGMLACGREGKGHLAEHGTIVDRVAEVLSKKRKS